MQTVPHVLGVAHPTGYPTYILLSWFAQLVPVGSVAFRANLLSAVLVSGALATTVAILLRLGVRPVIAAAAALVLGAVPTIWAAATVAEVNPLHLLFVALLLHRALVWEETRRPRDLVIGGLLLGLALGNHLLIIFVAPFIASSCSGSGGARSPPGRGSCCRRRRQAPGSVRLPLHPARRRRLHPRCATTTRSRSTRSCGSSAASSSVPSSGSCPGAAWSSSCGSLDALWRLLAEPGHARRPDRWASSASPSSSGDGAAFGLMCARHPRRERVCLGELPAPRALPARALAGPGHRRRRRDWNRWRDGWPPKPRGGAVAGPRMAATRCRPFRRRRGPGVRGRARGDELDRRAIGAAIGAATTFVDAVLEALPPDAAILSEWDASTPLWHAQYVLGRRPDVLIVDDTNIVYEGWGTRERRIASLICDRPVFILRLEDDDLEADPGGLSARALPHRGRRRRRGHRERKPGGLRGHATRPIDLRRDRLTSPPPAPSARRGPALRRLDAARSPRRLREPRSTGPVGPLRADRAPRTPTSRPPEPTLLADLPAEDPRPAPPEPAGVGPEQPRDQVAGQERRRPARRTASAAARAPAR